MPRGRKADRPGTAAFLHVPRTGGSSAWRYLAGLCRETYNILDLHHEATVRFGHERYAFSVLATQYAEIERTEKPFLVHHHGIAPLNALLKDAKYYTIIRDPVHRLVGYYNHVKALQVRGVRTNEIDIRDMDIMTFYSKSKRHLVTYCFWFGAMMWQDAGLYSKEYLLDVLEPMPLLLHHILSDRDEFIRRLVDYMMKNFAFVGLFDHLGPCVKMMARQLGVSSSLPALPHVTTIADVEKAAVPEADLAALCAIDIAFYKALRAAIGVWD